jgi:hypothetical protein
MKIPVVRVSRGAVVGTPEDFETQYERRRKKGSGRAETQRPQAKLRPIQNKSFEDRLQEFGIEGEV